MKNMMSKLTKKKRKFGRSLNGFKDKGPSESG